MITSVREELDDWSALFAWRDGDMRAADVLANRYFVILTRFFLNKVCNIDDASDLVADTFLGCSSSKSNVQRTGSFRSYLFAVAMNKLRHYYRAQAKRKRELDDFAEICVADAMPRTPSSLLARAEETQLLVNALRRLSLAQQIVLELHYFEGMDGNEIAEVLSVKRTAVYAHMRRGKGRLEKIIGELASTPELAGSTVMVLETWVVQVRGALDRWVDPPEP